MNIGFDIDGVLTNIEKYQLEVARNFYKRKYGKEIVNPKGFSIKEIYDVTDKEFMDFWIGHLLSYSIKELSRTGASECIKKLISDGNHIYIITSREFTDKNNILGIIMRKIVIKWLQREGIPFEKIIFCSDDKTQAIKNNNIQVMVEDSPTNIEQISKIADVICMNASYNEDIELPRVYRVKSFADVYETIEKIREQVKKSLVDPIGVRSGRMSIDRVHTKFYNERQAQLFLTDESIYQFIYRVNKDNMDALAIDYYDKKISFKEFFKLIDDCSKALKASGIKKGDVVTICMPNTPEGIIAFYAVNKIGAVASMVHPLASENEIRDYLNETKSKLLICIENAVEAIDKIIGETSVEKAIVVRPNNSMPLVKKSGFKILKFAKKHKLFELIDNILKNKIKGIKLYNGNNSIIPISIRRQLKSITTYKVDYENYTDWNAFIEFGKSYSGEVDGKFDSDELAVILHTGGSSGKSKGVMLSNENINSNTIQLQYTIPHYKKGDKLLAITPIFHGFGLVDCVHTALGVSMSLILMPNYDEDLYYKSLMKHPALVLGVPTLLKATINNPKLQNQDVPYNVFICGGDHLFREVEEEANNYSRTHNGKIDICKGGGMTEATAAYTFTMPKANKLESAGIPLPLNSIMIINPGTGEELPANEVGEICLSGPTVMLGYYKNEEETKKAIREVNGKRWLYTGDLGYLDEDGRLFYTGRISRMLISSGYNIYPQQIEKVLMKHELVSDVVVVGVEDPKKGQVPTAKIVLKNSILDFKLIREELLEICFKYLPKYSIPVDFEFVDSLPKTLYNKVDYKQVEKKEREKVKTLK